MSNGTIKRLIKRIVETKVGREPDADVDVPVFSADDTMVGDCDLDSLELTELLLLIDEEFEIKFGAEPIDVLKKERKEMSPQTTVAQLAEQIDQQLSS